MIRIRNQRLEHVEGEEGKWKRGEKIKIKSKDSKLNLKT
jgi:hypothetical protein